MRWLAVTVGCATIGVALGRADMVFHVSSGCGTVQVNEVQEHGMFDLTVCAEWPQDDVTYVVYTPVMPQLSGMTIADHVPFGETLSGVSQTLQRIVHQFRLLVTNQAGTRVETGPIQLEYRRGDREERERRELAGLALTVVRPPRTKLAGVALAAGAAAGLGVCVLAVSAYTFRRRSRSAAETAPCIECRLLAQLEESKRARLDGDLPRYFLTLEQLLRAYLRAKYCIGSLEDWQAPANGPAGLDERTMAVARELAHMAQRVRYAGYAPSAHEQRRMHEFLHSLFIRNQPRRQTPDEHLYLHMENAV